ncbi:hypothetical protein [Anaplasma phagocytophilum]|nr:hypothetical protein [Anaplasma phagocytophilum]
MDNSLAHRTERYGDLFACVIAQYDEDEKPESTLIKGKSRRSIKE